METEPENFHEKYYLRHAFDVKDFGAFHNAARDKILNPTQDFVLCVCNTKTQITRNTKRSAQLASHSLISYVFSLSQMPNRSPSLAHTSQARKWLHSIFDPILLQ